MSRDRLNMFSLSATSSPSCLTAFKGRTPFQVPVKHFTSFILLSIQIQIQIQYRQAQLRDWINVNTSLRLDLCIAYSSVITMYNACNSCQRPAPLRKVIAHQQNKVFFSHVVQFMALLGSDSTGRQVFVKPTFPEMIGHNLGMPPAFSAT